MLKSTRLWGLARTLCPLIRHCNTNQVMQTVPCSNNCYKGCLPRPPCDPSERPKPCLKQMRFKLTIPFRSVLNWQCVSMRKHIKNCSHWFSRTRAQDLPFRSRGMKVEVTTYRKTHSSKEQLLHSRSAY